jgi:hypothetical protein
MSKRTEEATSTSEARDAMRMALASYIGWKALMAEAERLAKQEVQA